MGALGIDISTSVVGFALLWDDGTPAHFSYVDLRRDKGFCDKCDSFSRELTLYAVRSDVPIDDVFIEDRLMGFAGGRTSQQTLMKVGAFNGACTYIAYDALDVEPTKLHPSTVKATMRREGLIIPRGCDKKVATLEFVMDACPEFPYEEKRTGRPKDWCFDMADAYITARAGQIKSCE